MLILLISLGILSYSGYKTYSQQSFDSDFVFYSVIFMILFFCLPGLLISSTGQYSYVYRNYFATSIDLNTAGLYLLVFLAGFYGTNVSLRIFYQKNISHRSQRETILVPKLSSFTTSVITFFLLVHIISYLITDHATYASLVRSGQVEGSKIEVLVLYAFQMLAVFCAVSFGLKKHHLRALGCICIVILYSLILGGRASFLFSIALIPAALGISTKRAALLGIACLPFLLPFIVDGKQILYLISSGRSILDYDWGSSIVPTSDLFYVYYDSIIDNFGHPLISLLNVDGLLEIVGYRYFYDILHGFLFYLQLFNLDTGLSLTYYNTLNLIGLKSSIIPTGYLAFGFVQMHMLGILFMGAIYRLLGILSWRAIDGDAFHSNILKTYVAIIIAYTFYTGEIRTIILVAGWPLVCAYLYSLIMFRRVKYSRQ